jgi:heme-binding protein/cytochrome P460
MQNRSPLRKTIRVLLVLILFLMVAIQFIRPRLDNPPVTADLAAPPAVKETLRRACYDCHSNETKLAWFDQPAPAYWMVVSHVRDGRKVLNFSHWDSLSKDQQAGKLFESLNQVEFSTMPLRQYAWFHHGARITPEEIAAFREYVNTLVPVLRPDTSRARAANIQYVDWIRMSRGAGDAQPSGPGSIQHAGVLPVANGIAYIPGFSNWKAISTTERFDNGTMRVIFGNDIAVSAIREGHTHPWPKGATFAKVAWDQLIDSTGEVYTGAFRQVEFMIRDDEQYASTDGWGWGRWRGMQLTPYGKDAGFTTECINCHKPMRDNDHVFTMPIEDTIDLYDRAAILPDSLHSGSQTENDAHPLAGKVISSFIDRKEGTMSTLYGNDIAVNSARSGQPAYPAGSVLSLVTWSQRDDGHWFGARIPAAVRSVEQITFTAASGGVSHPSYEKFEGMPLQKKADTDPGTIQQRITYLTTRKASVMP